MGTRQTETLLVRFSDSEITARKEDHYAVLRTIDEIKAKHRDELKPHKSRAKALVDAIELGGELRDVECEWCESLVNGGGRELVRLDTGEVVDTSSDDPEDDAPASQPSLFDAPRPAVPVLRCSGVDADGEAHPITAEQADAADREIAATGRAVVFVGANSDKRVEVVKVLRARACGTCGAADGHHRPECKAMQRDEQGPRYIGVDAEMGEHDLTRDQALAMQEWLRGEGSQADSADGFAVTLEDGSEVKLAQLMGDDPDDDEAGPLRMTGHGFVDESAERADEILGDAEDDAPDSYDRNDTAAVAAKIAETPPPNDRPLSPKSEPLTKVKPKKTKKAANAGSEAE